jgi:hypothetical protein
MAPELVAHNGRDSTAFGTLIHNNSVNSGDWLLEDTLGDVNREIIYDKGILVSDCDMGEVIVHCANCIIIIYTICTATCPAN